MRNEGTHFHFDTLNHSHHLHKKQRRNIRRVVSGCRLGSAFIFCNGHLITNYGQCFLGEIYMNLCIYGENETRWPVTIMSKRTSVWKIFFSAFYAFAGTLARNCTFGGLRKEMLIISYNLSKEQFKKKTVNKITSCCHL